MNILHVFEQLNGIRRQRFHPEHCKTVYCAFVEIEDDNTRVLSMACGMKCLPALRDAQGRRLPHYRDVLRDMHAEILARRALIRYLLANPGADISGPVYMVTTQVPCGDASILPDQTSPTTGEIMLMRGKQNWSRINCPRTKPGRADAPNTECMSCTDKIKLWLALGGIQGKRVSRSVPLNGIVIGGKALDSYERASIERNFSNVIYFPDDSLPTNDLMPSSFEAQIWHAGISKAERIIQGRRLGSKGPLDGLLPNSSRSIFCDSSLDELSLQFNQEYVREKDYLLQCDPYLRHYLRSPP